jgi:hypothetical protein
MAPDIWDLPNISSEAGDNKVADCDIPKTKPFHPKQLPLPFDAFSHHWHSVKSKRRKNIGKCGKNLTRSTAMNIIEI